MHFLIARHGGEYRYAAWLREHPTVAWSPIANANRLEPVVEQALAFMFRPNVTADLTVSTRLAEQVTADLIEMPEQLATGAIGCEIEVLCREGKTRRAGRPMGAGKAPLQEPGTFQLRCSSRRISPANTEGRDRRLVREPGLAHIRSAASPSLGDRRTALPARTTGAARR